jgi:hypothetical protein
MSGSYINYAAALQRTEGTNSMSGEMKNLTKDVQERVRNLAYLMWESAGRQQNMALQYWLNAEREIFSSMQAATDAMIPGRTQRRKAAEEPSRPSPVDTLEAPEQDNAARQDEQPAAPPSGNKLALAESKAAESKVAESKARQPVRAAKKAPTEKKALTEAAAEAPTGKPAPRKTGGRRKTTNK